MSLSEISLQNSLKNATLLKGHKDAIEIEKNKIFQDVESAKKWLVLKPDYLKFIQHLQHLLHQKNIGIFSELLTYFVRDVLHKEKEIVLDLYTYHNLPALRIEAKNNGFKESIYEGNGGSIANIVSTGLRLISLSRMQNRKFIILDEPDCWLAPQHIPLFAKIIGEISQKLRIQTVLISHHSWEYFKNYGRVIELKKDGAHLSTEILHDTPVDEYPDDYITDITLRRFMSHYDTTYSLHPYLTCIVGENDIGKSVVAPAMKALSYGDSSDSYIQHNENEAQVVVSLSNKTQFLWQRFLTTSNDNPQKVKFSLFNDGVFERSEFNASESPVFIQEKLKIALTEDIDIHIGNQKQPVFLLSGDVKPQERAKILSLGKESLIIQKMMETIKSKTKILQQVVKEGEVKYDKILRQLKHLENIETSIAQAEALSQELIELEKNKQKLVEINSIIPKYKNMLLIEDIEFAKHDIEMPQLYDTDLLNDLISQLKQHEQLSTINLSKTINIDFVLNDTEAIEHHIIQLQQMIKLSSIEAMTQIDMPSPLNDLESLKNAIHELKVRERVMHLHVVEPVETSSLKDNSELLELIADYKSAQATLEDWRIKGESLESWKIAIDKEIEDFLAVSGHKCPTCGHHLDAHSIKEHINDRV